MNKEFTVWRGPERRCFSTLGCHERCLDDILTLCRKYAVNKLEIRGIGGELVNAAIPDFAADKIDGTCEKFKKAGVRPYILGTNCAFDDEKKAKAALEEARLALDTAKKLGCFAIRVFGNRIKGDRDEALARINRYLGLICDMYADSGINVLLEVHGDYNTVENLTPVVSELKDRQNFGIIWDILHTHAGYGSNWSVFYTALKPYIRHIHIKDIKEGALCLPGDGDVPLEEICSRLFYDGYTGTVSLEWERKWHPDLPLIEEALDRLM